MPNGTIFIDRHDDPASPPRVAPNPAFPHGVILDGGRGAKATCDVNLPYPARGRGVYTVGCRTCGITVTLTVAGRPDDPVRLIIPCGGPFPSLERLAAPAPHLRRQK